MEREREMEEKTNFCGGCEVSLDRHGNPLPKIT
jgi:hypothetical protein